MANDNDDLAWPPINVVPTQRITAAHLSVLLERFRAGETEPLVFGDDNVPEAAVIPFEALGHLIERERDEARDDQAELSRRIQNSDASDDPGATLDELSDDLEEPARSMLRKTLNDG